MSKSKPTHADDQILLAVFVKRAKRLGQLSLAQSGPGSSVTMAGDASGLSVTAHETDPELFRSLLMDVRLFVSEKEFVFVGRIHGICQRRLTDDDLRAKVDRAYRAWLSMNSGREGIVLEANGVEWTPKIAMDAFINGVYFHTTDLEKERRLEELQSPFAELVRHQFSGLISVTVDFVLWLSNAVEHALERGLFDFSS